VVLLGYVFAHSLAKVETGLKYWALGVLAVLAVSVATLFYWRRRAERDSGGDGDGGGDGDPEPADTPEAAA
jgi:hypothetical protein